MIPTWRKALYAALVTVVVLVAANAAISLLERGEVVDTRRLDDLVHHVDDALFAQREGAWHTTPYAERGMLPSEAAVQRDPDRLRVVLTGGSFAMGTPYSHQRHGEERPGGMASWLRAAFAERLPEHPPELLNLAAGGQSSTRVVRILEQATRLQPDLVIVASCNNEGSITPNAIEEGLRQLAGVRFSSKLLRPGPSLAERPAYTPQSADYHSLQSRFEQNLARISGLAREHGFELLLCTLPVNLRYEGELPGKLRARSDGRLVTVTNECKAGDCAHDTVAPCASQARTLMEHGDHDAARAQLEACDDLESVRLLGLMDHAQGAHDTARGLLNQYAELVPRGRCRPGLNRAVRTQAQADDNATIVDLDRHAAALSPDGIADPALFVDNCHLSWVGYGLMADRVLEIMEQRGLLPPRPDAAATTLWELAQAWELPPVARMDLVGGPSIEAAELQDPRDPWSERPGRPRLP